MILNTGWRFIQSVFHHIFLAVMIKVTDSRSVYLSFLRVTHYVLPYPTELPSLQPVANIPTEPNGGNHTPQFAESARSEEAHDACMQVAKGLAMTALRVLVDDMFYNKVSRV